jgi:hypothetical protein
MTHRQAKLPLVTRIIAAGCIAIWVAGVSACDLEALFCCESQAGELGAHADQGHDTEQAVVDSNDPHNADAHHSDETDGHTHNAPTPDSKEGSCCSALKAVAQTSASAILGKPVLLSVAFLCVPLVTQSAAQTLVESGLNRPDDNCDRILTPEVCLGPAFQGNAPPALG